MSSTRAAQYLGPFVFTCVLAGASADAQAISFRCSLGMTECVDIQGKDTPLDDAERMATDCADFTRRNIGRRVLRMSFKEILEISGGRQSHPLLRASLAYDSLHDSSLQFDRSLPIEQRYLPLKRACGAVFRATRHPPPSEDDD